MKRPPRSLRYSERMAHPRLKPRAARSCCRISLRCSTGSRSSTRACSRSRPGWRRCRGPRFSCSRHGPSVGRASTSSPTSSPTFLSAFSSPGPAKAIRAWHGSWLAAGCRRRPAFAMETAQMFRLRATRACSSHREHRRRRRGRGRGAPSRARCGTGGRCPPFCALVPSGQDRVRPRADGDLAGRGAEPRDTALRHDLRSRCSARSCRRRRPDDGLTDVAAMLVDGAHASAFQLLGVGLSER